MKMTTQETPNMSDFQAGNILSTPAPSPFADKCCENEKHMLSADDGHNNITEDDGGLSRKPEYPNTTRLLMIVIAVVLSIFLMSLDMVGDQSNRIKICQRCLIANHIY